jgi:hypothetical protein
MKFKYTKIFSIIGLIISLIFFFNSSSILKYFLFVISSVVFIGLIGLGIDYLINKKFVGIIYLIIGIGFILILIIAIFFVRNMFCGGKHTNLENLFTKECKTFYVSACSKNPPWYYIQNNKCKIEEKHNLCTENGGIITIFRENCSEDYVESFVAYRDIEPGFKCCLPIY